MLRKFVSLLLVLVFGFVVGIGDVCDIAAAEGSEVVTIPDPNLEAAIREQLGKPTGDITAADMESLNRLYAEDKGISSLEGIQCACNLKELLISYNEIDNIEPLSELKKLERLEIGNNKINNIEPLSELTKLKYLYISSNKINSIEPLSKLLNLEILFICDNGIDDINSLSKLTNLKELYMTNNKISNIEPLSPLTKLRELLACQNKICNINPLSGLKDLECLEIRHNKIDNIEPLSGLGKLQRLDILGNNIGDITPLLSLAALEEVVLDCNYLDVWRENINKTVLEALISNGVWIRFYVSDDHVQYKLQVEENSLLLQTGECVNLCIGSVIVADITDIDKRYYGEAVPSIDEVDSDTFRVNVANPDVVCAALTTREGHHYLKLEALQPGETTVTVALGDSGSSFTIDIVNVVVADDGNKPEAVEPAPEKPELEAPELPRTNSGSHYHVLVFSAMLLAVGGFLLLVNKSIQRSR